MSDTGKKNIVICGYPKSGTVWCMRLVAELLECPVVGHWHMPDVPSYKEGEHRSSAFNCFQSHHLYNEVNKPEGTQAHKIICIVRDPRDILISGAFHFRFYHRQLLTFLKKTRVKGMVERYLKSLDYKFLSKGYKFRRMRQMIEQGDKWIPSCEHSWNEYIRSFQGKTDVLLIRYEDLLSNGLKNCHTILEHCGIEKTDEQCLQALEKQSFKKRKASLEQEGLFKFSEHLRKGVAGDWKNYQDNTDLQAIQKSCGSLMKTLGYTD